MHAVIVYMHSYTSHLLQIVFKWGRNQIKEWCNLVAVDASVAVTEKSSNNIIKTNELQKNLKNSFENQQKEIALWCGQKPIQPWRKPHSMTC